jgi:NAD+ kinase
VTPSGFSTVGVIAHPERDCGGVFAAVHDWATAQHTEIISLAGTAPLSKLGEPVPDDAFAARADLVIAAGGDGTMLRALAIAAPARVPVLGVNVGRLGFLAEVDPPELPDALAAITAGEFSIEKRLALDGRVTIGSDAVRVRASNDLVLGRIPGSGQAEFAAFVDGELFTRYVGDGLIVSTPTGSTAYSLSAGGPIVSPTTEAMLLTAIAPHGVFDRSLVVAQNETIRIELLENSAPVVIECDGRRHSDVVAGDALDVSTSSDPGLLIRLGGKNFYRRARQKLQLVDPLVLGTNEDPPAG